MERPEVTQSNLSREGKRGSRSLSVKGIQEYLSCPACFFGRRVKRDLDKPPTRDIVEVGMFLSAVIASAHTSRQKGLKFESTKSFIGFANFRYTETLIGGEKEATKEFLASLSNKQRETINHILASYFEDNKEASVIRSERVVEGQLGGSFIWGRIDQVREGRDLDGSKVLEIIEMKFNQEPNIWNCFQLGVYTALFAQDPKIQLPTRQIIYDLLGRQRFILNPRNPNLIPEIISALTSAIEIGYDEKDNYHQHFPQKQRLGGSEGVRAQFPSWQELTRPPKWDTGQRRYRQAKEKLGVYFKTTNWQVENLRETS